jgi:hypothetical protein
MRSASTKFGMAIKIEQMNITPRGMLEVTYGVNSFYSYKLFDRFKSSSWLLY